MDKILKLGVIAQTLTPCFATGASILTYIGLMSGKFYEAIEVTRNIISTQGHFASWAISIAAYLILTVPFTIIVWKSKREYFRIISLFPLIVFCAMALFDFVWDCYIISVYWGSR